MKIIDETKPHPYQDDLPRQMLNKLRRYEGMPLSKVVNPNVTAREFIALADGVKDAIKSVEERATLNWNTNLYEMPIDEPVLVEIAAAKHGSVYQIAVRANEKVTMVGNYFSFDMPKMLRWKSLQGFV